MSRHSSLGNLIEVVLFRFQSLASCGPGKTFSKTKFISTDCGMYGNAGSRMRKATKRREAETGNKRKKTFISLYLMSDTIFSIIFKLNISLPSL